MQCSRVHKTFKIIVHAVSLCTGNNEHWSFIMKFMGIVGERIALKW
jgi:hypothetical protein